MILTGIGVAVIGVTITGGDIPVPADALTATFVVQVQRVTVAVVEGVIATVVRGRGQAAARLFAIVSTRPVSYLIREYRYASFTRHCKTKNVTGRIINCINRKIF
ncbi:MAG: hypothetical protein ACYDGO_03360 [Smithellaceae bacterium]